jgi:hypothetical protein
LLRDGYAVLEGFLGSDEVLALRPEVEGCLRAPHGPSCERPNNTLVPLRWDDSIVERVLASKRRMDRLIEIADADDPRWISGYLSIKEPRSLALWWHQDWWCWDHPVSFQREPPQIAVLCYLTSTNDRNGALRVLPGSHHARTPLHTVLPEAHGHDTSGAPSTHPAMADHPGQVTLPLRAGDAVVIDYRLLHGTHANTTDERRDCLLLAFTPSWRALPTDIRSHLIQHPALPSDGEGSSGDSWPRDLLPRFDGPRRDLPLNRVPPPDFAIVD